MGKELQFPGDAPDQVIGNSVAPLLAPPMDGDAYWAGLHQRIMARVADAGASMMWWSISPMTARAGLLAAGLALLALGALALQTREIETRLAFDAVVETELEVARVIPGIDEPFTPRPSNGTDARR
jgi:hypothetical protein